MRRFTWSGIAVGSLVGVCAACILPARETKTVTRSVELDKAESVNVELRMGAGELRVNGGGAKLMDASFQFNVPSWEPVVDYQGGARATLRVQQPDSSSSWGNVKNNWDLRFNDTVPIELTTHLGAGEATMTLGSLNLRSLEIHHGAGELNVDLRGTPKRSYDVRVNGGVGTAHIRVPQSVAIVANATGGLGSVSVKGLEKRGDSWVNPQHENDPIKIRLDVKGGVGEIVISAE